MELSQSFGFEPKVPDSEPIPTHCWYPLITISHASTLYAYLEPQIVANVKLRPNVPNKENFFLIWPVGSKTVPASLIGYFGNFKSKLYFLR